ncbi:type II toxin-antitoxin system YhaV family toxin [Roseovarius spongiae]|uniref:Type II toxin-antitoxin system YhaV family toxin n=1 Tax=Roseovarius spongiae TaxID=2320272 RepID=A0A3A8B8B0_9RHOB|nr:type II toxin-antitoxin system YhaV family toxin [Roseovarius spongiae]RKF13544.1 type II toxin-antitoxin system YhaV family toxin [Roseovarius spongiae]
MKSRLGREACPYHRRKGACRECQYQWSTYRKKAPSKILAATEKLTKEVIPADPASSVFDLGNTIGPEHRTWKRAKFLQQSRLFFRHDMKSRIIIYGRVNNENTKRAYGSKTDTYRVFQKRLAAGDPPSDWNDLIKPAAPVDLQ